MKRRYDTTGEDSGGNQIYPESKIRDITFLILQSHVQYDKVASILNTGLIANQLNLIN